MESSVRIGRAVLLLAVLALIGVSGCHTNPMGPVPPGSDRAFLDTLQERTFRWFVDYTNPENGLTRDRAPTPSFASVAAVGFALTAWPIG
ncbi:MAG: Tat pathway signal protein, partial [Gemmatimonadetes bacterium]|nr:Tat pathway signal protein [Gemmatimonadota bacterium]NIQ58429.1 Tat pathway signal protein [Gemmatimonadota bacterium]NIU78642.1 Tat pathway signal protein [Gammaproteobacteria bacterium]NIX47484.1 Tat pathway signal protein [Gemmatimonadota bacterium]NIY11865.1 Tat pathway signal protein [Gemmatimonadota bacterium]